MVGGAGASVRILVTLAVVGTGCGRTPARVGVLVNEVSVTKVRIDPVGTMPGRRLGATGADDSTVRQADVLGDEELEALVALPRGQGIEVRDRNGSPLAAIRSRGYLTDFGVLTATPPNKHNLVLYTYPNRTGGGTFTVLTPDERELASWDEQPPPGRFVVGRWDGRDAILYLRSGHLVMRSPDARQLVEVAVPDSDPFDVREAAVLGARTIVLASGDGYTPFHMVLVLEPNGALVFGEVGRDQALGLESSGDDAFVVSTRSGLWRYSLPPARVP